MRMLRLLAAAALTLGLVGLDATTAAPPAAAEVDPAPTVGLVGDSVPFQALFDLMDTLGADRKIVFSHAGLGLEIRDVLPPTLDALRGDHPPDIFLVFIGTHQSNTDPPRIWQAELRRLLDLVSPRVDCVRVFEVDDEDTGFYRLHDRRAATYNRITRQVTEEYDTAEWYHFDAWAGLAGPEFERPDILHHNRRGALALGRLMQAVANSCDPALTSGPFWDVPDDHPAAEAIAWVGDQGLFGGYPNHTYRAEIGPWVQPATRGAFASMAWKLAGRPTGFDGHPWTDGGSSIDPALDWVADGALLPGLRDGSWRPLRPITRAQALNLLWRQVDRPDVANGDPWTDVEGPAFGWAAAGGLLTGYADQTFRPTAPLTRAQMAKLLFAFAALPPPPSPSPPAPPSAPPTTTIPPTTSTPPPTTAAPSTIPSSTIPPTTTTEEP